MGLACFSKTVRQLFSGRQTLKILKEVDSRQVPEGATVRIIKELSIYPGKIKTTKIQPNEEKSTQNLVLTQQELQIQAEQLAEELEQLNILNKDKFPADYITYNLSNITQALKIYSSNENISQLPSLALVCTVEANQR